MRSLHVANNLDDLLEQGDSYWRFSDMTRDSGYPKKISAGFSGIPNSIDAAFVWSGNGKIYFFKVRSGVLPCVREKVRDRRIDTERQRERETDEKKERKEQRTQAEGIE